jgi:hypothetical protein
MENLQIEDSDNLNKERMDMSYITFQAEYTVFFLSIYNVIFLDAKKISRSACLAILVLFFFTNMQ